jgi:hypothetical protein
MVKLRIGLLSLLIFATTATSACTVVTKSVTRHHVHRVALDTGGASATVDLGSREQLGRAPTQVPLRYSVTTETQLSVPRLTLGILGVLVLPASIGGSAFALGVGGANEALGGGDAAAPAYAIGFLTVGVIAAAFGVYGIYTAWSDRETIGPRRHEIGLRFDGVPARFALTIDNDASSPKLTQVNRIVFDPVERRWQVVGEREGLSIGSYATRDPGQTSTPASRPARRSASKPASATSQPTSQASSGSSAAATAGPRRRRAPRHRPTAARRANRDGER